MELHTSAASFIWFEKEYKVIIRFIWVFIIYCFKDCAVRLCSLCSVVCSGVTESAQLVSTTKEMYNWILSVPSNNINMIFQEVSLCVLEATRRHLILMNMFWQTDRSHTSIHVQKLYWIVEYTLLFKSLASVMCRNFKSSLLCSSKLHLFDKNTGISYILKYKVTI